MARFRSPFRRAFKVTEPFFLQWHLTERCNLSCRPCYRETPREERDLKSAKVLFSAFREFLQRRPQGRARIQIAGGEPLLSPLLLPVLEMARAHGLPTRVLSNGSLIGLAEASALAQCDCRIVQLSLDGTPETHDALRGKGSFDAVLRAAADDPETDTWNEPRHCPGDCSCIFHLDFFLAGNVIIGVKHMLIPF